jgi:hypothetical protein
VDCNSNEFHSIPLYSNIVESNSNSIPLFYYIILLYSNKVEFEFLILELMESRSVKSGIHFHTATTKKCSACSPPCRPPVSLTCRPRVADMSPTLDVTVPSLYMKRRSPRKHHGGPSPKRPALVRAMCHCPRPCRGSSPLHFACPFYLNN